MSPSLRAIAQSRAGTQPAEPPPLQRTERARRWQEDDEPAFEPPVTQRLRAAVGPHEPRIEPTPRRPAAAASGPPRFAAEPVLEADDEPAADFVDADEVVATVEEESFEAETLEEIPEDDAYPYEEVEPEPETAEAGEEQDEADEAPLDDFFDAEEVESEPEFEAEPEPEIEESEPEFEPERQPESEPRPARGGRRQSGSWSLPDPVEEPPARRAARARHMAEEQPAPMRRQPAPPPPVAEAPPGRRRPPLMDEPEPIDEQADEIGHEPPAREPARPRRGAPRGAYRDYDAYRRSEARQRRTPLGGFLRLMIVVLAGVVVVGVLAWAAVRYLPGTETALFGARQQVASVAPAAPSAEPQEVTVASVPAAAAPAAPLDAPALADVAPPPAPIPAAPPASAQPATRRGSAQFPPVERPADPVGRRGCAGRRAARRRDRGAARPASRCRPGAGFDRCRPRRSVQLLRRGRDGRCPGRPIFRPAAALDAGGGPAIAGRYPRPTSSAGAACARWCWSATPTTRPPATRRPRPAT